MVTAAPDFSLMVLERLEKISPGEAGRANSSPMRAADDATSTDTGEDDVQGADALFPVETLDGLWRNLRSKKPGRPSAVRGTLVAGCIQVVRVVRMSGFSIRLPSPTLSTRAARSSSRWGLPRPEFDMFPRPVINSSPMPPKRLSRLFSNSPGQSALALPPLVPNAVRWAAWAPTVAIVSPSLPGS